MEVIEKLDVMEGGACHQYLDGPRDDVQSMASIGECGDEWWNNQQAGSTEIQFICAMLRNGEVIPERR